MTEEWRDIPGYEDMYQVSDLGRVRSLDRVVKHPIADNTLKGKVLKQVPNPAGYLKVNLCGKTYEVARLVMLSFVGPRPNGLVIRHGPAGKQNNSAANLCYGTQRENTLLDNRRDGTDGGRKVVRDDGEVFQSVVMASEASNTSRGNITHACQGRQKTAGGFGWRYI